MTESVNNVKVRTMFYSVQETVTKTKVLNEQTIASCVVCLYKLCCLLFYCFKMNWWDSNVEKLIQKFCFQFHLVRKTGTRKLVPVFWYQFSVPISGACVFGISVYKNRRNFTGVLFQTINNNKNNNSEKLLGARLLVFHFYHFSELLYFSLIISYSHAALNNIYSLRQFGIWAYFQPGKNSTKLVSPVPLKYTLTL